MPAPASPRRSAALPAGLTNLTRPSPIFPSPMLGKANARCSSRRRALGGLKFQNDQTRVVNSATQEKTGWKQKVSREMLRYGIYFVYLSFFLGAFLWYRRLILAEYHIAYSHYGFAIIEALIMAKVILIGDALRL